MITLDEIKQEENYSHSLVVTYPRTIQISHGVYDNVVDMMNMCTCLLYTSPSPRDRTRSRMPSSA